MNLKKGTVRKAFNWQQVETSPTVNIERKLDGKQIKLTWTPPMRGGVDRRFEVGDIITIDRVAIDKPVFDRFLQETDREYHDGKPTVATPPATPKATPPATPANPMSTSDMDKEVK